jgi:hypothetical protein
MLILTFGVLLSRGFKANCSSISSVHLPLLLPGDASVKCLSLFEGCLFTSVDLLPEEL